MAAKKPTNAEGKSADASNPPKGTYQVRIPRALTTLAELLAALREQTLQELVKGLVAAELREQNMLHPPYEDEDLLRELAKLAPRHPGLIPTLERVGAIRPSKR